VTTSPSEPSPPERVVSPPERVVSPPERVVPVTTTTKVLAGGLVVFRTKRRTEAERSPYQGQVCQLAVEGPPGLQVVPGTKDGSNSCFMVHQTVHQVLALEVLPSSWQVRHRAARKVPGRLVSEEILCKMMTSQKPVGELR
jgi:hypothetical protein